MAKTKTLKARTLMSLQYKIDDARKDGWEVRGGTWTVCGVYYVSVTKVGA